MSVSVYEAKTHLSRLIDKAAEGEEIVITRHGRPVAKLVSVTAPAERRKFGTLRGRIKVSDDFDAALPADVLREFEGGT